MERGYGIESARVHPPEAHRAPARYLVLIDSGGVTIARLFLPTHEQVAEFDAGIEEVAQMTAGLAPATGAGSPEWDRALAGHTPAERAAARVYTLPR